MNQNETIRPLFDRIQSKALIPGAAGLAILLAGAVFTGEQFYQSYLYGFIFWILVSLGCLGILLLHHLVSGGWGHIVQRVVEAGTKTLPYMAALFIPIVLGMDRLYPWTRADVMEASHILHHKAGYLNVPFFVTRTVLYFILWSAVAFVLVKWSTTQDKTADASLSRRMKILSGPMMVLFVLTVTFASVDWLMSLEPEWYSTIYGAMVLVGGVLSTLAFCIIMVRVMSAYSPLAQVLTTRHVHHLGNLLMAFTILWAYMAFSQYLIIWSGNLPEDNFWYLRRFGSGWQIIALILIIGHFFVPFFLLLSRRTKRMITNLARIASGILVMRFVDLYWLIMPAFNQHELQFHWLTLVAPIGIGGIWVAVFIGHLKTHPLLPEHDPRFGPDGQHAFPH